MMLLVVTACTNKKQVVDGKVFTDNDWFYSNLSAEKE